MTPRWAPCGRPRAVVGLLLLNACASALHERPIVPLPAREKEGASSAPSLLAAARESYGYRPNVGAVQRSVALFLQAAANDEKNVEALVGAIRSKVWLIEHETDSSRREELAVSAVDVGQECERRAPGTPACDYWLALAIGLQARERPSTATDALKRMVDLLKKTEAADPNFDDAGPHRVLALLMLRAPAWPVGPGDPEGALAEAQQAVTLRPDYPPNQLALGEALEANGQHVPAREAYAKALDLARTRAAVSDPDAADWQREAEKGLR